MPNRASRREQGTRNGRNGVASATAWVGIRRSSAWPSVCGEEHTPMRHGHVSRKSHSGKDTSPVPTLERIGPHAWKFPESAWEVSERFYNGCELWEAGNTQEAFAVFQDLLQRHPEHLDRRDSLAHIYEEIGQDDRAKALLEEAVALGRRAFPKGFRAGD